MRSVLFETPSYFASIEQARALDISFELIPTYQRDGYVLPDVSARPRKGSHVAIWLTQPRAALGFNQEPEKIAGLLERLGRGAYLVVDEATDQSFPAHLGTIGKHTSVLNLIRIRSFAKGMGLNGLRLAAVLHPTRLRSLAVDCLEMLGGSLDIHSLIAVNALGRDIARLRTMLVAANQQVTALRIQAERLTRGSALTVNRLTNGYIGSMVADLSALGRRHHLRRRRLLAGCRRLRTPVILGASFYMACDPPREGIRLNFFSRPDHVLHGIRNILTIVR